MHTSKCRNLIEAVALRIESVDYRFLISLVALVDIHPLSCKYGINGLLSVILNDKQDLNTLPRLQSIRENRLVRSALQSHLTTSQITSQEMGMFTAQPVSARTMRQRLQQCALLVRGPIQEFLLMLSIERDVESCEPNDKARKHRVPIRRAAF